MNEIDVMLPTVQPETKEEKESKYMFSYGDQILAGVMFALAYLAVDSFSMFVSPAHYGVGVTFYTLLYGICILIYGKASGYKMEKEGWFWFLIMGICAVSYSWIYHQSLMEFQALFLRLVTLYFTASVFGVLITGKTGSFFVLDGINVLILIPIANIKAQWCATLSAGKSASWIISTIKAGMGLVIAIPLFVVIISLLSGADANFEIILDDIIWWMEDHMYFWAVNLFWAVPLGMYLYALVYGSAHKRGADTIQSKVVTEFCHKCAVVPRASVYAVFMSICGLYILFIGLQGGYYLDALRGVLPEAFTYSEYARKGFFELVTISVINMGMILVAALLCKRVAGTDGSLKNSRVFKMCTILISVLTLFLIGTAITKMFLYIKVYGLTPLRVIPSLFMVFLAMVFLLIIIAQFKHIPVVQTAVYVFAIGYALLSISNMDGWVASYNLNRYLEGTLADIPKTVLKNGSLASIPAMYQVWSTTEDEDLKQELAATAIHIGYWSEVAVENTPLKDANITKRTATRQLMEMAQDIPEGLPPDVLMIPD